MCALDINWSEKGWRGTVSACIFFMVPVAFAALVALSGCKPDNAYVAPTAVKVARCAV